MPGIVLLLGAGVLWWLLQGKGSGSDLPGPGVIPEQELALLTSVGGHPVYRPEARPLLLQRLKTLRLAENLNDDGSLVLLKDEARIILPTEAVSAYEYAKSAHGQGYNVWISPTLMGGIQDRYLLLTTQSSPNPSPNAPPVALLVSFADAWPADTSDQVAPLPNSPPPASLG